MAGKTAGNTKAKVKVTKPKQPPKTGTHGKATVKVTNEPKVDKSQDKKIAALEARVKQLEEMLRAVGFGHKV